MLPLPPAQGRGKNDPMVTEEIDLDAESLQAPSPESKVIKPKSGPRLTPATPPAAPNLPTSSPFELSEHDLTLDAPAGPRSGSKLGGPKSGGPKSGGPKSGPKSPEKAETDTSSDFELIPLDPSKSPLELGSGEIPLLEGDEEVDLGNVRPAGAGAGNSGINLGDPVDSGISLEQGGSDEIEFELSLDSGVTPKPAEGPKTPPKGETDSSSEFELSLDEDSSPVGDEGSSEFELTLDAEGDSSELALEPTPDSESGSDSEFELTLDAEGELAVEGEGKDIFEATDFDVPALEEDESGSEAVALEEGDSDIDSDSDFELSLDADEEGAAADSSESQVVALEDEEEADAGAATVARPKKTRSKSAAVAAPEEEAAGEDWDVTAEGESEPEITAEGEAEGEEEEAVAAAPAAPAEWGPWPALLMFPAVVVLFVVGLMGYELIQGMWGYHQPNKVSKPVIHAIAKIFDDSLPKD
jgi:hypothetical protein